MPPIPVQIQAIGDEYLRKRIPHCALSWYYCVDCYARCKGNRARVHCSPWCLLFAGMLLRGEAYGLAHIC